MSSSTAITKVLPHKFSIANGLEYYSMALPVEVCKFVIYFLGNENCIIMADVIIQLDYTMDDTVIRVENLSKRYRIGNRNGWASYGSLRESIANASKYPIRKIKSLAKKEPLEEISEIWALKDVSFTVKRGETLGIIGRNGAGKSTLLKVLSRITKPTSGRVVLRGRVGSLLEVGTGFHPELTGRENIYLNGAILGMTRHEIERKFDEIVDFAEIEQFLETPVKFYSTGMYMRLAFAVAAHLEPEILLVDEVLAVGDVEFQKKCLGKMGQVAQEGRTVLFVSHQMTSIREFCSQCIWLNQGIIKDKGISNKVIKNYMVSGTSNSEWIFPSLSITKNPYFNPSKFCLVDEDLNSTSSIFSADAKVGVLIEGEVEQVSNALTIGFAVFASEGELLFWAYHTDAPKANWPPIKKGRNRLVAWIPPHLLNEGSYRIELIASLHFQEWLIEPGKSAPALWIDIRGGLSKSPYWMTVRPGLLAPHISFQLIR